MRLLKRLLGLLAALVLLLVAAAIVLPLVFDPDDHRERIVAAVERATGRTFSLEGEIGWSVFPTLSLTAGPVALGNDPAFPEAEFLRAGQLSASLAILPLLQRRIEVGQVALDGVELALSVAADGSDNWSSLQAALGGEPADDADTAGEEAGIAFGLSVEGFRLTDARVAYRDASRDLTAEISGFSIAVAPIRPGETARVRVSGTGTMAPWSASFEADAAVDDLLGASGPRVALRAFELDVEGTVPARVTLAQAALLDLGAGTLSLQGLQLASRDARATLAVEASNLLDAPAGTGSLEVAPFDLRRWLEQSGLYAAGTTDPRAMERVSAELGFRFAGGQWWLDPLTARLDDTSLTGTASRTGALRFDLAVDTLDVDRYLPPEATAEEGGAVSTTEPPDLGLADVDGTLRIGRLTVAGVESSDITLTMKGDASGLRLAPIAGSLYGGSFEGAAGLRTDGSNDASLELRVRQLQAGGLLGAWMERPALTGTGELTLDVVLDDAWHANPLSTLNGSVSASLVDGALYGINVVGILRGALAMVGRGDPAALSEGDRRTDFSSFRLQGDIAAGTLTTREFAVLSPYLRVGGGGRIDLAAGRLDFEIRPTLVDTPEGQGSELAQLEGTTVPIVLTGPLARPEYEVDVATAVLSAQGGRLERELRQRLGLDAQPAADDEQAARDREPEQALKGLLLDVLERKRSRDGDSDDDDGR